MRAGGRSWWLAGICALTLAAPAPAGALAAPDELGKRFVPDEVIVGFDAGAGEDARAAARRAVGADLGQRLLLPRTQLLELDRGRSVRSAVAALERRGSVRYAEPNRIVRADVVPNDGFFGEQWGLHNTGQAIDGGLPSPVADADIDAPEAWDVQTGDGSSAGPVVAVVDTGVAYDHPDLDENIWANPLESGGTPGFDDDGNGLVDDVRGWDFVTNDPGDPDDSDGTGSMDGQDDDPADLSGHGTHVAGILGAEGNNMNRTAGVSWDTRIMPLRALGVNGAGTTASIASAFAYAGGEGADIVNASLSGGGAAPQPIIDAIDGAPNTLFVVAAGNLDQDNDAPGLGRFPCNIAEPKLICVASSDQADDLSSFSNFGATSVDLAAPGSRIRSTYSRQAGPLPLAEDFDPDPGWTTGGAPDTWAVTTENGPIDPFGPTLPTSLTDSPGAPYAASTNSFAASPPINLGTLTRCALEYSVELDMNSGDVADFIRVQTSPDGNDPWTTVDAYRGAGPGFDFGVDLTGFDGDDDMRVRFNLVSDADATVDDGAWFDNVVADCGGVTVVILDGTSMATPMVAGVAALALSEDPTADVAELRNAILAGVDPKPDLADAVATGGRLNALNTLELLAPEPEPPPPAPPPGSGNLPPAPPPGPPNTAPVLDVSGKKKQKGRKVTVKAECDEACTVSGKGRVRAGGESGKLKRSRERDLDPGETGALKLKLSGAAREAAKDALKAGQKARAKVSVTARDAEGLTDRARFKITLKD